MAPVSPATARSREARAPRRAPDRAPRPSLRLVQPGRRRRLRRSRRLARPQLWVAGALVVGSLFAVVAGDAVVAQGQIRLADTQQAIAAATATEKAEQVTVAGMAAPPVVVRQAEALGLVAPASIVDLPTVPLNVPLPVPNTTSSATPLPASAAPTPAATPTPAAPPTPAATPAPAPAAASQATAPASPPATAAAGPSASTTVTTTSPTQ